MRGERTKSILSFQRAVKMNPSYAAAWTFMGHEYNELKNTSAAILCYQKAIGYIDCNFSVVTFHLFFLILILFFRNE